MPGVRSDLPHRHLVRSPGALDRFPVDLLRAGPALGGPKHDHRPARAVGDASLARGPLDVVDLLDHGVERHRELLVDERRVVAGHEEGVVPVALHERPKLLLGDSGEDRRTRDLVAVEVEDRQHRAVALGIEELVRMPAGRQRSGLGLTVADDGADEQIGVVERGAVGVRERVPELATLVDRARRLRRDVAGDAARERELAEERPQAGLVRVMLG